MVATVLEEAPRVPGGHRRAAVRLAEGEAYALSTPASLRLAFRAPLVRLISIIPLIAGVLLPQPVLSVSHSSFSIPSPTLSEDRVPHLASYSSTTPRPDLEVIHKER